VRKSLKLLIPTLAASGLVAACGSSSTSSSTNAEATQPAASQTSSGASLKTAANSTLHATILVDAKGMTLYHLSGEQGGKFICTSAACVKVWVPLAAVSGSKPTGTVESLGTVKRPDGTEQVSYKAMPLYTFAGDHAPGDAHGQRIKDVGTWSAVTTTTSTASAPATTTTSTSSSSAYGY
jgi:predicted lipoprotein with Yx(FWY)xxD motif